MIKKLTLARRFIAAGIVSLMAIIGTASLNAQGLEEGLIGYWPFDDQSDPESTPDMSEGGNHGTVNGEPEFVIGATGGGGDNAIQFDGADDSVTTEVSLLNDLEELTLSFWVLMPEAQPGNRVGLIGQNDAVEYGMISPSSMQYWTPAGNISVDFGPTLEEWTHVAVVVNADGMHVYANGEQIGTAGGGGAVSSGDTFNMGGDGVFDAEGNWFLGAIDDVAVWNIALSEEQIAALAAQQIFPIARAGGELVPGLIAYWPFDGDLQDAVGDSHGEGMGSDDIVYASGKFGQGIELDGVDQFVETPLDNEEMFDFQDGTGFSISAWYKVGEFTKSWQALIAKGEGNRWRIHRRGGENILTGNGGNGDVPAGTPDINDGELHHIVLVSDPENDEVRLYSDGELSSSNNAPAIQSNENPMMIGENPDARNRTWSGIIDDVGIWNRPITESEIALIW
ncbi:LamG domain-containing protein, partial [Verrucomicrobia bacterium]|nr:LamG domain-containing protein [Verrucomicrobiota bacterium]